jgi:hypothetical protein
MRAPTAVSDVSEIVTCLLCLGWLSGLWFANWDLSRRLIHGRSFFDVLGVSDDLSLWVSHHISIFDVIPSDARRTTLVMGWWRS